MEYKWIGKKINTSGSYRTTVCDELMMRYGGQNHRSTLYKFESRFGETYYISNESSIKKIEEILAKGEEGITEMYEYLYTLVVIEFGAVPFIIQIGHKIARERDLGYKKGKAHLQEEFRGLLGLK